jgi:2'-5' RNA ligase
VETLPELPIRFLKGKNIHITVVPPWETDRVREVEVALQELRGQYKSFSLQFEDISLGPNPFSPRLLWATGVESHPLHALKEGIEQVLHYKPDRSFHMHLTLGRFREADKGKFPSGLFPQKVSWQVPVSSFVLMESQRLHDGAEYDVLYEVPLSV